MISSGVDSPQVDRGRSEVGVTELALNDVQRHSLAGGAPARARGAAGVARTGVGRPLWRRHGETRCGPQRPTTAARGSGLDDAEQRTGRQSCPSLQPRSSCSQPHSSIPTSRRRRWPATSSVGNTVMGTSQIGQQRPRLPYTADDGGATARSRNQASAALERRRLKTTRARRSRRLAGRRRRRPHPGLPEVAGRLAA